MKILVFCSSRKTRDDICQLLNLLYAPRASNCIWRNGKKEKSTREPLAIRTTKSLGDTLNLLAQERFDFLLVCPKPHFFDRFRIRKYTGKAKVIYADHKNLEGISNQIG
jgi:hypothetical protein